MPAKLHVMKADVSLESAFTQPEFGVFRNVAGLLRHLFARLQPHGLRLQDVKIERGGGSVGDYHIACNLYNFTVVVRVRTEKVEVLWLEAPEDYVERFASATVEALSAVKDHLPAVAFRAHSIGVAMHGRLEGESVREYLSRFVKNIPGGLGPQMGNGGVLYFGAEEDRLLATVTMDLSAVLPDGLFFRTYVIWDASKVEVATVPARTGAFVRLVMDRFGLEVPTLRS